MRSLLRKLTHVSLAKLWGAAQRPRLTLWGPARSSDVAALRRLFPERGSAEIESLRRELPANHQLARELGDAMLEVRGRRVGWPPWSEFLYAALRLLRPALCVETGVFDGLSSSIILQALEDSDHGRLISVDLPAVAPVKGSTHRMTDTSLPPGLQPGWLIPERLRARHRLELGDSRELLPGIFEDCGGIDAFLHDSLHTHAHMSFEYRLAWGHLRPGGLLLSDDIGWNDAFYRFCREQRVEFAHLKAGFGAARKP